MQVNGRGNAGVAAGVAVGQAPAGLSFPAASRGRWVIEVYDPTPMFKLVAPLLRTLVSEERFEQIRREPWARQLREIRNWRNIVVDEGKNYLIGAGLAGSPVAISTWYLGLMDGTPTVAAGDTLASHAGWAEVQAYTEANRVAWTAGAVSGGSVDNSGAVATFSVNADSTVIGGAFLASDNVKGGTTGTLYAGGAFSGGDLTLNNGSTLDVTATFSV